MAAVALYIAVYMWKYGNDASIVVQSTVCNGWMFLFLGTLALLGGQIPPEVRVRRVPWRASTLNDGEVGNGGGGVPVSVMG